MSGFFKVKLLISSYESVHILIDASRFQSSQPTGVEVYSNHVIQGLIDIAMREQVHLTLCSRGQVKVKEGTYIHVKKIPGKRLWTLFRLSRYFLTYKREVDSLFVPSHILPLILPERSYVVIHDVAWKHFPESYSRMQRILLDWSTKFAIRHAKAIVVVSEATKDDLIKYYHCPEEKVKVVHSGFDREKFLTMVKQESLSALLAKYGLVEKKYFIYVGRVEEKKNIPFVVDAFLKANLSPEWKLLLVGKPGVGFGEIEKKIKENSNSQVILTGYLPSEDTYTLLSGARASVLASKYEGFGFPVLEAFAVDVPVIASDIPALREVGGDAPYFIKSDQINTLIQSFKIFSQELYNSSSMVEAGRKRLSYFSWKTCVEKIWEIISAD